VRVLALATAAQALAASPRPDDVPLAALTADEDIGAAVEARGSRADFLVVGQPQADDATPHRRAFRAALLATERPVLMVPAAAPADGTGTAALFGERVGIAWRDDARAVKAVMPALRLLTAARAVHLLTGLRPGVPAPAKPAVLAEHGIEAEFHQLAIGAEPFGKTLLARLAELQADLLIMGAYAHNPLHEALLGGLTRYMVANATLPVLFRH
jgi:nucleotide-binding universal stress UspA family protein